MYKGNRVKRALSHAHTQWNGMACSQPLFNQPAISLIDQVKTYLKGHQISYIDREIIVTDVGYVVMAIHCNRAVKFGDILVLPGVDSEGRRGHLVLCEKKLPYHSMAANAVGAYVEAKESRRKAQALLSELGSKTAMKEAVSNTPWYALVTMQDLERSGLCQWGSESFMQRYGLRPVAQRFGLPKLLVQATGAYGERLIAARTVRCRNSAAATASLGLTQTQGSHKNTAQGAI